MADFGEALTPEVAELHERNRKRWRNAEPRRSGGRPAPPLRTHARRTRLFPRRDSHGGLGGDRGAVPMRSVAFGMWRHAGGHAGAPSFAKRRRQAKKRFQSRPSVPEREFEIYIRVAVLPKFVLLKQ